MTGVQTCALPISVHSGHSQRESWEGYNLLFAVLDEISGFDLDSTSGNEQAKTASAIYKMFRGSDGNATNSRMEVALNFGIILK